MLTFPPGELSTIAGLLTDCGIDKHCSFSTKQYNFQDLPCPPQSVMVSKMRPSASLHRNYQAKMKVEEKNWYKPQAGEPYRPLIAMPKQILQMNPLFELCTDNFFTGYDPPKTLNRATALSPTTTNGDYEDITIAPKPSPTPDAGARKTPTGDIPKIRNVNTPAMEQPALQFKDEGSNPENEPSHPIQLNNSPTPSALDPEETSGNPPRENNAQGPPGGEASPNPPIKPMQTIATGIEIDGSYQNTASAISDIPAQANNAKTTGGEPGEDIDQAQSADPGQTTNTTETTDTLGHESPSEMNKAEETSIAPETDEDPTKERNPGKPDELQSNTALPKLDPFRASPNEIFRIEGAPSKTNESKEEPTAPETYEEPTQDKEPGKPDESPPSKITPSDFNPLRASPNQIYGIEAATFFHPQQSGPSLKSAHKEKGAPNQQGPPGRVAIFGHVSQNENVSGPLSSQVPDLQTPFVAAQAIKTTPTIAAATSRTALSPVPPQASVNEALDKLSASANTQGTSAPSFDASEMGSLGNTPATTAGSSADATDSLSPTHVTSSMGKINRNMGTAVQVSKGQAWVVVAMLMLLWMG